MFYERKVGSMTELMKEIRRLDSDAGVRLLGTYEGRRCLVFVSRTPQGFAAIVCSAVGGSSPVPGRRLIASEFKGDRDLQVFLRKLSGEKTRAFVY